MGSRWFMTRNDGGEADGEGIFVEYRKHIPSRRGDSRIARPISANAVRTDSRDACPYGSAGEYRIAARIAPYRSLPPRGRGTAIAVEGACAISIFAIVVFLRILPQSPSAPVSDPGHKHGLLPALAKNMPQAYFLNASRPPGGSLTHRRMSANTVQTGDSCRPWSDIATYGSVGKRHVVAPFVSPLSQLR